MGTKMRVDGSLMGLDDKRTSLLPQWKRGHFSLLFDGSTTPATMLLCDHTKKKYLDLSKEKKKHKPSLEEEVGRVHQPSNSNTWPTSVLLLENTNCYPPLLVRCACNSCLRTSFSSASLDWHRPVLSNRH